jgi:hypothetical protein
MTMRDPVIHTDDQHLLTFIMDGRVEPGHDEKGKSGTIKFRDANFVARPTTSTTSK